MTGETLNVAASWMFRSTSSRKEHLLTLEIIIIIVFQLNDSLFVISDLL